MQRRVGAEGVLPDVLKGTQALDNPINIFAPNRRAQKKFWPIKDAKSRIEGLHDVTTL